MDAPGKKMTNNLRRLVAIPCSRLHILEAALHLIQKRKHLSRNGPNIRRGACRVHGNFNIRVGRLAVEERLQGIHVQTGLFQPIPGLGVLFRQFFDIFSPETVSQNGCIRLVKLRKIGSHPRLDGSLPQHSGAKGMDRPDKRLLPRIKGLH